MYGVGASGRSILLALVFLVAFAPSAGARVAYVTGTVGQQGGAVAPLDLAAQATGAPLPLGGEGSPPDVAITPDGRTAYVVTFSELWPVDVGTNTPGVPIPGAGGTAVAITPDGRMAYVVSLVGDQVVPVDLATGETGSPIAVGSAPRAIAITPDGRTAFVANDISNTVTPIDLATHTAGPAIPMPEINSESFRPTSIAVTPDGLRAFVSGGGGGAVWIEVATHTVGPSIPLPGAVFARYLAITPDGSRVYVVDSDGNAFRIDAASGAVGPTIPLEDTFLGDIAILPSGASAYATVQPEDTLAPLDLGTDAPGAAFATIADPLALAIVPNQPPHASFNVQLSSVPAGVNVDIDDESVYFDATGSTDPDGSVTRYDWDFGDGATAVDAGPTARHRYSTPGTYTVTLTVTDNEGCSVHFVFTGQTAYCNGSVVARTSRTVVVTQSHCPRAPGDASSFVPKIRPGRTQLGVRVRLATTRPSLVTVSGELIWSEDGEKHSVDLEGLSVSINRWRRVRFVLPRAAQADLGFGDKVTVKLRIETRPRQNPGCAGKVTKRTLRVKVVKVIPGAVQRGRLP